MQGGVRSRERFPAAHFGIELLPRETLEVAYREPASSYESRYVREGGAERGGYRGRGAGGSCAPDGGVGQQDV